MSRSIQDVETKSTLKFKAMSFDALIHILLLAVLVIDINKVILVYITKVKHKE